MAGVFGDRTGPWFAGGNCANDNPQGTVCQRRLRGGRLGGQASSSRIMPTIGCGPHGSVRIAPFLLRSFANRYPNSELRLVNADDQSQLRDVSTGLRSFRIRTSPAFTYGNDSRTEPEIRAPDGAFNLDACLAKNSALAKNESSSSARSSLTR